MSKRILIICRKPPYGNSLSREAIDLALATAVFDQELAILFVSDGVWQLKKEQNCEQFSSKNHGKALSAFPLYDITALYVEEEALKERMLNNHDLLLPVTALNNLEIQTLIDSFDVVLSF